MTYEHNLRSIVKTITYRTLIVIETFIVSYLLTGKLGASTAITFFVNLVGTIIYYVHERVWNLIHWGRNHQASVKAKRMR